MKPVPKDFIDEKINKILLGDSGLEIIENYYDEFYGEENDDYSLLNIYMSL